MGQRRQPLARAERRDSTLTDLSWIGSTLAGGLVIPVVVGILVVAFLLRRKWLLATFTLFVIAVESGSYRATTLIVGRDRPPVHRLEGLDPTASFPSGHIAATVALYGGLLLVLASRIGRRWFSALALIVTLALVLFIEVGTHVPRHAPPHRHRRRRPGRRLGTGGHTVRSTGRGRCGH